LGLVETISLLLVASLWSPLGSAHLAIDPPAANCGELKAVVPSLTQRLSLVTSACVFNETASLTRNATGGSPATTYNLSSSFDGVAEIDSAGSVVQYSNLLGNVSHVIMVISNYSNGQIRLGFEAAVNVTPASGNWTPGAVLGGEVKQGGSATGSVVVQLVFVLQVAPANSSSFKLDVGVSDWPWESPTDHLGLLFGAVAEPGAHLAWNQSSRNLTETMNSGGESFAGLRLGQSASTSWSGGGMSAVNVSSDVGYYSVGTPLRGAYLLVNFTGVNEEYTSLHYDPWIIFTVPVLSSGAATALFDWGLVVAIVVGSVAALLLGVAGFRARRIAPEAGMRSLT
jgi:hypothetical protein